MTPPRWEVADVIRMVGTSFLDSLTRAQRKVLNAIVRCRTAALGGHRDQCVRCGYQTISFLLMPESPLPEVSGQRTREVAPQTAAGTAARRLLSHRFQRPSPPDPVDVAKQEAPVLTLVPGYRFHAPGSGRRSQASRRGNRLSLYSAHLGTDPEQTSAYPLRGARRRSVPGSHPLDLVASSFLLARQGPQQCLSRQVRGWIGAGLSRKQTSFLTATAKR